MRPGRKRKQRITLSPIHERIASDAPKNAKVTFDEVGDPWADREPPQRLPALRRDGSFAVTGDGEWLVTESGRITICRATHSDPLGVMRAHGHVDEAQYLAGRHWQSIFERSELGNIKSVDTTKDPVQGGQLPDVLTDAQRDAIGELIRADRAIMASAADRGRGIARTIIVRDILGTCLTLGQVSAMRGLSEESKKGLGREFGAVLNVLAVEFGFATQRQNFSLAIKGKSVYIDIYNPNSVKNQGSPQGVGRSRDQRNPARRGRPPKNPAPITRRGAGVARAAHSAATIKRFDSVSPPLSELAQRERDNRAGGIHGRRINP